MQAIDISQTQSVIEELSRQKRILNSLQDGMMDVYNRLPDTMSNQVIRNKLMKQIEAVDTEITGYRQLEQVLSLVRIIYRNSENRIADYAEEANAASNTPFPFSIHAYIIPTWITRLIHRCDILL